MHPIAACGSLMPHPGMWDQWSRSIGKTVLLTNSPLTFHFRLPECFGCVLPLVPRPLVGIAQQKSDIVPCWLRLAVTATDDDDRREFLVVPRPIGHGQLY